MADSLIIVESPTKIRSIKKIVGSGYDFSASVGHIRDLPKKELGVDVDNNFKPEYEIMPGKKKVIRSLRKSVKSHNRIYLACDPDREGEAIAWHIKEALKIPDSKYFRITTNEITAEGVKHALANPRKISTDMVNAQQARRIMDRLVGYQISPLLWKKIKSGLSAGRVQSIAVKLIAEREREIEAFDPEEYWKITAQCAKKDEKFKDMPFNAILKKKDNKKIDITCEDEAETVTDELKKTPFIVEKVKKRKTTSSPYPPFRTSTLQRRAASYLKFSAKKTMMIAQQLYEGVELGEKGSTALITYMRTDSTRISSTAMKQCRSFIEQEYGIDYLPDKPRYFKTRQRAQEAHEAIRPTDVSIHPEHIKEYLSSDQYRLYSIIWKQFVASQMKNAAYNSTTLNIRAGAFLLAAQGRELVFDGYTRIAGTVKKDIDKQHIPPLQDGEEVDALSIDPTQHFTQPPKRYTQASLIRTLEKEGIGRPSTYASILSTIQSRHYVNLKKGSFFATLLGRTVTEKLDRYFKDIMDISFTARMEDELDEIAEAKRDWTAVLSEFYKRFSDQLIQARKNMKSTKGDEAEKTEHTCARCGRSMVIRWGRNGPFLGCEGYFNSDEKCTYTMEIHEDGSLKKDYSGPVEDVKYSGSPVHLKRGRYSYYLETESGEKASVPDNTDLENLDEKTVHMLFEQSKTQNNAFGTLEDGSEVYLKTGKYGPYIQVITNGERKNVSLPRNTDLESVSMDEIKAILALPRELGEHPESGKPVTLMYGKYGPYIKCGKENRSVKESNLEEITLEDACKLLATKPKRGRKRKRAKKKK